MSKESSIEYEWGRLTVWGQINERLLAAKAAGDTSARFEAIRTLYGPVGGIEPSREYIPYPVDWMSFFTPIEEEIWCYIRRMSLPFYPQWTVDKYFIDFADPEKRIAIECDGADWHNPAIDGPRQRAMESVGWSFIRIPGWQCMRDEEDRDSAYWLLADLGHALYGRRAPVRPWLDK